MNAFFITGTDTDVGKSVVSAAMLHKIGINASTLGYKPVSAGCQESDGRLLNGDAMLLQRHGTVAASLGEVNPIAFKAPVAPHLAAEQAGCAIAVERLVQGYQLLLHKQPDLLLVEGAGGWRLPLGQGHFMPELPQVLELPVILVVGLKLGCINHSLLTVEAIQNDGLKLVGWVGNGIDPQMDLQRDNIDALTSLMPAPCLGIVPFIDGPEDDKVTTAASHLNLQTLV